MENEQENGNNLKLMPFDEMEKKIRLNARFQVKMRSLELEKVDT